jgi:predicted dehydrogenase
MAGPVDIVLFGIGGYGNVYLEALLGAAEDGLFRIAGVVDPEPGRCDHLDRLRKLEIPVYSLPADFYGDHPADLAVISSPPQYHCPQTCLALSLGSHVLCEKPAAATLQEVDRMLRYANRFGRWVAVGYQWSFSSPIQALKRDILSGTFGTARRLKSLCLWPRDESYYRRNDWAGRLKDGQGNPVLDSPVNNAMAHYLHNLFFLLGDRMDRSAEPGEVLAALYRANDIETFDTAALRARTDDDVEVLFYASHAVPEDRGPVFTLEFDEAVITYEGGASPMIARFRDGSRLQYESPESDPQMNKLWTCIEAVRDDGSIPCGLEAARSHTLCVKGVHECMSEISVFPSTHLRTSGSENRRLVWVEGLADALQALYEEGLLPKSKKGTFPFF